MLKLQLRPLWWKIRAVAIQSTYWPKAVWSYPRGIICSYCHKLNFNVDDCGFYVAFEGKNHPKRERPFCNACGDKHQLWPNGER